MFKASDGGIGYTCYDQRAMRNPREVRNRVFKNTILAGIFSKHTNYERFVGKKHWMMAEHVLPIAVHLFKLSKLVLYSNVEYAGPIQESKGKNLLH